MDLQLVDALVGAEFDLDNIDSLWYHQLDYEPFLRQQLVTPVDKDKAEAFLNEYGLLRLIKSFILQMVHLTQSLLTTMPSLIQILKEHRESNPTKVKRLTKQLEEKEVELVN